MMMAKNKCNASTYRMTKKDMENYIFKRLEVLKEKLVTDINNKETNIELSILRDALSKLEK